MDTEDWGDSNRRKTYAQRMSEAGAFLILKIETKEPIEVTDFVGQFISLSNQYEKYIRAAQPDLADHAEIFVTQVKEGSIVAHLIPYAGWVAGGVVAVGGTTLAGMHYALVLEDFVKRYGGRISPYFKKGGRDIDASRPDLRDFHSAVAAIANDPNGVATLEAAHFEDGKKKIGASFTFTTPQARIAEGEIEGHKQELEKSTSADHERVLMVFVRPDIRTQNPGKRSGELVVIEKISDKPLPLIYASALAEQRIKYEIRDDESVFKKGFVADVNVELRKGKACAYRVTNLHQVIDLPDENG